MALITGYLSHIEKLTLRDLIVCLLSFILTSLSPQKESHPYQYSSIFHWEHVITGDCCGLLQVDDEAMELNKELMQKLLELDDVDAVYIDQK